MKKKGILLLGSLTLMVIAMVFITVTLVSRANVTPESSVAATLKKKDLTVSSLSSKPKTSLPSKYTFQKLDMGGSDENITYSSDVNDLGFVVGTKFIWEGGYMYQVYPAMWDPNGNLIDINDPHFIPNVTDVSGINNSNVIIGNIDDLDNWRRTSYKYSVKSGYKELPGYPQEKRLKNTKLVLPTKMNKFSLFDTYSKITNTKSPYSLNEATVGDITTAFDINNDGDVIGESNLRGLLWKNETNGYLDLSTIISQYYVNPWRVVPFKISDRVNGDVKIAGFIQTLVDNNTKNVLFIMDYSITNSKVVSFKLIEDIGGSGRYPWTVPQKILSDESILSSYYYFDEFGFEKIDAFLISPKGNYESSVRFSDYLKKTGLNIYFSDVFRMNDSRVGLGMYARPDDRNSYHYFIYDFNTNQIQEIESLIKEGSIIGYIPGTILFPHDISKTGEIMLSVFSIEKSKRYVAKLIPVK